MLSTFMKDIFQCCIILHGKFHSLLKMVLLTKKEKYSSTNFSIATLFRIWKKLVFNSNNFASSSDVGEGSFKIAFLINFFLDFLAKAFSLKPFFPTLLLLNEFPPFLKMA